MYTQETLELSEGGSCTFHLPPPRSRPCWSPGPVVCPPKLRGGKTAHFYVRCCGIQEFPATILYFKPNNLTSKRVEFEELLIYGIYTSINIMVDHVNSKSSKLIRVLELLFVVSRTGSQC